MPTDLNPPSEPRWRRTCRYLTKGVPRLFAAVTTFVAACVLVLLIQLPAAAAEEATQGWSFNEFVWLVFVGSSLWVAAELRRLAARHAQHGERLARLEALLERSKGEGQ
jgi:hypothetical protein